MDIVEKAVAGITTAVSGWIYYIHRTRPSRKECENKHETVAQTFCTFAAKLDGINEKMDIVCQKIDKTNDLLIQHIIK